MGVGRRRVRALLRPLLAHTSCGVFLGHASSESDISFIAGQECVDTINPLTSPVEGEQKGREEGKNNYHVF